MRSEDVPSLRGLPLFAGMSDSNFDALFRAAYLQIFPTHVELFSEGDKADFLFLVVDGCVELYASWNGRETTMAMVTPYGTFILAAVVKDASYLMAARTADKSRILMIPSVDVRKAFELDEAFARAIVVELAGCYRGVIKSQKNLKLRSGVERLAAHLLTRRREQGDAICISLPHDKRTLAALLGMTPENLSRAFATLRTYGVSVDGSSVTLSDLVGLAGLAKPTPLLDDASL